LSYRDRHLSSLTVPGRQRLMIDQSPKRSSSCNNDSGTSTIRLLDQVLAYAVHLAEDDDDDNTVDWSIQQPWPLSIHNDDDGARRVLVITLHKAVPMVNVHVWWKRLFVNEIDRDESNDPIARKQQQAQFKTTWEQAHEQFRANINNNNNKQ
jgi:hypothetical protein